MAYEGYWATHSSYLTNNKLTKAFQKAAQPLMRFRQFCAIKESFGKHQGESVNWLKVSNLSGYGGTIAETDSMPETTLPISWGTVSVQEYGLALPFTFKLEALSEFDWEQLVREGLLDDCHKVIDGVIERKFNETKLRYVGTSATAGTVTTDGTATATNTSALNSYHLRMLIKELKTRNVPGFPGLGGDYVMIAGPDTLAGFNDALEDVNQYTESGYKKLLNGEIGRYMGCRIIEDNFGCSYTYSASARTATAKSWSGGKSLDAYVFGSPTVREAIAVPEEIRVKVPTDYGRSKGIAWYMIAGYAIEWDAADDSRIIKWDSNA